MYDELLQRAFARAPNDIDKSEGSFIYDAIPPCVAELCQAYLYIEKLD